MAALSIAFEAPDNYRGYTTTHRPIDLVHLARQTSGDKALELEVLHTFARQARCYLSDLSSGNAEVVTQTAHKLKGAALAILGCREGRSTGRRGRHYCPRQCDRCGREFHQHALALI
jgi:hypothetical protein